MESLCNSSRNTIYIHCKKYIVDGNYKTAMAIILTGVRASKKCKSCLMARAPGIASTVGKRAQNMEKPGV